MFIKEINTMQTKNSKQQYKITQNRAPKELENTTKHTK